MKRFIAIAALAFATPAFAGEYTLDLEAAEPQIGRMDRGREQIESNLPASSLRIMAPAGKVDPRAYFTIVVRNDGDKPFNFGPENVRLFHSETNWSYMLTYEQLVKIAEGEAKGRAFWAALAAGLNSYSASQAGNYSGTVRSRYGTTSFSGNNAGVSYFAQRQAAADNAALIGAVEARHLADLESLENVVRTTTVDPAQEFGGVIVFGGPKLMEKVKGPYPITLEIKLGDEVHRIKAMLQRK